MNLLADLQHEEERRRLVYKRWRVWSLCYLLRLIEDKWTSLLNSSMRKKEEGKYITLHRRNTKNLKQIFPEKGTARPQYQFPHSCVCEWFIYSHNQSACSAAGEYVDWSWEYWEYTNRSQTCECGNWDCGHTFSFLGIHKWDVRCIEGMNWKGTWDWG